MRGEAGSGWEKGLHYVTVLTAIERRTHTVDARLLLLLFICLSLRVWEGLGNRADGHSVMVPA